MAQSRNNPVGETERESKSKEREREGGGVGGTASRLVHYYCPWNCDIYYTCASAQATNRHPLPPPLPVVLVPLPDFITYLPRPFLPTGAALRSNETKSHKWPQCFLACYSPLAPPPPCTPLRTRRPCPKCKLIACTN